MLKTIFLSTCSVALLSLLSGCASQQDPKPSQEAPKTKKVQKQKSAKSSQDYKKAPRNSAALSMKDYVTWQNVYKDDDNEHLYVDLVIVDLPQVLEKQKTREPQAYALYEEHPDVYHERLKEYFRRDTCVNLLVMAQKEEDIKIKKVFNTRKGRLYYQIEETKESCEELFK